MIELYFTLKAIGTLIGIAILAVFFILVWITRDK